MSKIKHDWQNLKVEYFESKENGLADFLRSKYGDKTNIQTGIFQKNTNGWYREKQAFLRQVQAVALQRAAAKAAKVYEPNMKELGEMHRATVSLMQASLQKMLADSIDPVTGKCINLPDVRIVESIWKMTKAEKREPTEVGEVIETTTPEQKARIENVLAHVRGRK